MGEGLNLLDVVCYAGRLLSLASFVYFLYLMFDLCKVLNVFSSETVHHFVRRKGNYDDDSSRGNENAVVRMQ